MTDITRLTQSVQSFYEARGWDQFHNLKDLAIGISTEANELLDFFRLEEAISLYKKNLWSVQYD